jgi:hypothetical protein
VASDHKKQKQHLSVLLTLSPVQECPNIDFNLGNSGLDFDDPQAGYIEPTKPETKVSRKLSSGAK